MTYLQPRFLQIALSVLLLLFGNDLIAQSSSSLSLSELMGSPSHDNTEEPTNQVAPSGETFEDETETASNLSLSDLMGSSASNYDASAASLDLGTIKEGREIVMLRESYQSLQSLGRRVESECGCTGSGSCFNLDSGLRHQQVIDSARTAEASFSDTLSTVCNSWPGAGPEGQTRQMLEARSDIASKVLTAINEVKHSADDAYAQLSQQDTQITNAIAAQQNANSNSGFNWGQFAAMSVGVIAGGVAELDTTQQAEIFSSITMDSMNGGGSINSFQGTMDSLNADLASMQSQIQVDATSGWENNNVNTPFENMMLENQMINDAAEDIARTLMGEQVDISNRSYAVQSAVPDASSLLQGIGSTSSNNPTSTYPGSNATPGSANGFDPSMRPGGVTAYDQTGNASGIQGQSQAANHFDDQDAVINETYTFTCPHGSQATVPIVTIGLACANAMKNYAKVMSCNLIDEFESAQRQYESVCASEIFE